MTQITAFLTDATKGWDLEAFDENAKRTMAIGRIGDPPEIVRAALYFASDASSFVNGHILFVDGGMTAVV